MKDTARPWVAGTAKALHGSRSEPACVSWRILIVDDHRDSATSLSMLLDLFGHNTRVAEEGGTALVEAEAFRPDAVLLDIGLPGLDGWEVARRLRTTPWGREVALLALTGSGQAADRQRSSAAGFDGHLVKPVEIEPLLRVLAEQLSATAIAQRGSREPPECTRPT